MKTSSMIAAAALSLFAATAAQAQEVTFELPLPAVSNTTRAAVLAELAQARAAGHVMPREQNYPPLVLGASTRTRAEVQAELQAAMASGEWQALHREVQGFDVNLPRLRAAAMPMHAAKSAK